MFIRTLRIKGKTYYSLVESRRFDGKTRQVILLYLGTAEALYQKLKRGGANVSTETKRSVQRTEQKRI